MKDRSLLASFYAISAVGTGAGAIFFVVYGLFAIDEPLDAANAFYLAAAVGYGLAAIFGGVGLWRSSGWTYVAFAVLFGFASLMVILDGILEPRTVLQTSLTALATLLGGGLLVRLIHGYTRTRA